VKHGASIRCEVRYRDFPQLWLCKQDVRQLACGQSTLSKHWQHCDCQKSDCGGEGLLTSHAVCVLPNGSGSGYVTVSAHLSDTSLAGVLKIAAVARGWKRPASVMKDFTRLVEKGMFSSGGCSGCSIKVGLCARCRAVTQQLESAVFSVHRCVLPSFECFSKTMIDSNGMFYFTN
jgi:hypothetical protein